MLKWYSFIRGYYRPKLKGFQLATRRSQVRRTLQHEIDSAGEHLLREAFVSLGWVVNRVEHDYGVDFDIQVFQDGNATGEWFKVQLKSTQATQYSQDGSLISQSIDFPHSRHYSIDIRDPLFIIHADVKTHKTFWHAPQLDRDLRGILLQSNPPSTLTIKIPTKNELPASIRSLLTALGQIYMVLGAARAAEAPVADFARVVTELGHQERYAHEFQEKIDALKLFEIHASFKAGDIRKAREGVNRILQNDESSSESKFSALLQDELISWLEYGKSDLPQSELGKIRLRTSLRLRSLAKKGNPALKLFSLIAVKAAELEILAHRDLGLVMNWKGHAEAGHSLVAIGFFVERAESVRRVVTKYNQCLRLVRYSTNSPHLWALSKPLLRIVEGFAIFFIQLRKENTPAIFDQYFKSALSLCRLASDIAESNHDDDDLAYTAATAMLLFNSNPSEIQTFVAEVLAKIQGEEQKRVAQEVIARATKRVKGEHVEGDTPATTTQIIQNRATALGIDLLDDASPATKLVRLGIKDADPARVLAHCAHTFVSIAPPRDDLTATLSILLQLPSVGLKVLHCDLHGYSVEGPSLDPVCESFKSKYCDTCPDRSSRPSDWQYSDEWQREENLRHSDFMARFLIERVLRHKT
jgi:hypothetical protein